MIERRPERIGSGEVGLVDIALAGVDKNTTASAARTHTMLQPIDLHDLPTTPGEHRRPCAICDHGPSDDALAVRVDPDGSATWICHRCGTTGGTRKQSDQAPGRALWERGIACSSHPYLTKKQVPAFGDLRAHDGMLLIPVRTIDGEWRGLQKIWPDGTKKFAPGTKAKAAMHVIGRLHGADLIYIAEGYATAATVHLATEAPAIVAWDCGNLPPVARAVRDKYPDVRIVIAADDDRSKPKNPGRRKGIAAAQAITGDVAFPDFGDSPGTDHNDVMIARGLDVVRNSLSNAGPPPDAKAVMTEAISAAVAMPGVIVIEAGAIPRMVDQAAKALRHSGAEIYRRGETLVRVMRTDRDTTGEGMRRPSGAITLRPVDARWMSLCLASAAEWTRWSGAKKDMVAADVPMPVASTLADVPDAAEWPHLHAVVQHPVLIGDDWVSQSAYHSGLLIDAGATRWIEPGTTETAARDALAMLRYHLRHYRWAGDVDEAVALSLLLTAITRPLLDTAPMHAIDAPRRGSGKSILVDVAAILATGTRASVMDFGRDPAESEKRLDGVQLAGDPIIAIDNIERPLDGAVMCQSISQTSRRVRPLGASTMVTIPCIALFTATGNNLDVRGDLQRRVVVCRIDPQTERPELRQIDQDLIAETIDRRAELVAACQTIIRAHRRSGHCGASLGTFGQWSRDIRDALTWLGVADPVASMDTLATADPDREATIAVCSAWRKAYGTELVSCADVVRRAERREESDAELADALILVASRNGRLDASALGYWLRRHVDARIDTCIIRRHPGRAGTARWSVDGGDGGHGGDVYPHAGENRKNQPSTPPVMTDAITARLTETSQPSQPSQPCCPKCLGDGCGWCKPTLRKKHAA